MSRGRFITAALDWGIYTRYGKRTVAGLWLQKLIFEVVFNLSILLNMTGV